MDETEYNAIDAIRFSRLKLMAKSALHFRANPRNDSPAKGLGRIVHCRTLTPKLYADKCVIKPKFSGKGAVAAREAWEAAHANCEIVTDEQHEAAEAMASAVMACPEARELLDDAAEIEVPHVWTDENTGLVCKCKPDLLTRSNVLADLKTASEVDDRSFINAAARLHYNAQLAFYASGLGRFVSDYVLIVVQSVAPFDVVVHELSGAAMARGRELCARWLARVAECERLGQWPGVANGRGRVVADWPEWAMGDDAFNWEDAA